MRLPRRDDSRRAGFTLVELSIVLVILGLLVGGVLSGQSLIRASELRAVTTEYNNYKTALGAFKDKYMALPGDMPNATKYWGIVNADQTTCLMTQSTDMKTCDGDGDGIIGSSSGMLIFEVYRAWQHLANAGMIEGNYSGSYSGSSPMNIVRKNIPASKVNGGIWAWSGWSSYNLTPLFGGSQTVWKSSLNFGSQNAADMSAMSGILKPEEAYNIDMKMDDGKPRTGSVQTLDPTTGFAANCALNDNTAYALSITTQTCYLFFTTGY